ncbi:hypothetical protein NMG60_11022929 [Bertholletia excelsa]
MYKNITRQPNLWLHRCSSYVQIELIHSFQSSLNLLAVPSVYNLNRYLNGLWKSGQIDEARQLFDEMSERDEFTWNTIIAACAQTGRLTEAKQLFEETPTRSSVTWSSLISGYCRYGCEIEAFHLFWRMQYEGYKPSQFTLGSLLMMCASNALLLRGQQIHAHAIKTCFAINNFVNTGLVDMYAKCNCISEAQCLFEATIHRTSHVLWTAMITGYSQNNYELKALKCFRDMRAEGVEPNQFTFPSVLTACAAVSARNFGAQVHSCIIQTGFGANIFVASALVDMYAKCGDLNGARIALETVEIDDVVCWNSMIVGCVRQGFEEEALSLFKKMHARGMNIDDFTYPSVLNSYVSIKDMESAKSVHCLIIKTGFEACMLVSNALVDMYAKRGDISSALKIFNSMTDRDVVSWTSLVTGYVHNDSHEEAIKLFCQMRVVGINPDQIVIACILSACAGLTILEFGQQVHASFMKSGLRSTLSVDNSLVAMYAKCGCVEDAKRVFDSMRIWDVISWTALIVGYAQNGKAKDSLALYDKMIESGTKPDFITFIGLLFACSHAGLVEQGHQYFESMDKVYGIKPGPYHYACMIDLLGRAGSMNEAKDLLDQMDVEPDATVWKALLGACRVHGNIELAEKAAKALFELEPHNAMPYVMLSNIYSAAGFWEDAARVRTLMRTRGVDKEPGQSWIEMNSKVHTFMSEDRNHPMTEQIYSKIDEIMKMIKKVGYVPDMNFALHDIAEEGKELGLAYHSEKLAVAFALLFVPQGAPIRIYKNLRVCGDCHTAMKFISRVFCRHIILRDSNCFHHFKEGTCSCGEYW